MSFLLEFWDFLKTRKKYWLIPVILMVLLVGGLLVMAEGTVAAPFLYSLF